MVVVALRGRRKLAIEFLLLLGRQQGANLVVGPKNKLVVLMGKILVQVLHFDMGVTDQILNLMALVRGQTQVMIEAVNETMSNRDSQQVVAIGKGGKRKSDQHAGHDRQRDSRPFQTIAQDRYWFPESPR